MVFRATYQPLLWSGISATPERFITSMTQDAFRTLEQVQVPTLEVKKSGLIKDKLLVLHPDVLTEDGMTLLGEAVEKIKQFEAKWKILKIKAEKMLSRY